MQKDLDGKVILLTGATEGIGRAAALELASRGATLTLVGRNREKGERVLADIRSQSGSDRVDLLLGDLSKMADVRAVAEQYKAGHQRLDVLVNNAGAVFTRRLVSADGLEMTFALNHVGYFLLTHCLFDLLKATPSARVVSTSSAAHRMGRIDFDDIARCERSFSGWGAYGNSKLANILFTRELARRLKGTATANCHHPGFVRTGFALNNGGVVASLVGAGAALFARTPQRGAETLLWLAGSPESATLTGEYCHDRKIAATSALAKDDALAAKLWDFTADLCGVA
jgi:NAD(P)-dependent dehydrogenase (short-subunit alcohol dehydrogenase family)